MRTPIEILEKFEKATLGLEYETVTLILHIKQGKLRYVVAREESLVPHEELYSNDDFLLNREAMTQPGNIEERQTS